MSSPGPVEHVPLKVVPLYPEGENPELAGRDDEEPPEIEGVASRVRTPLAGIIALVFAVLTVVIHIAAVAVASAGEPVTGTVLAYVAIALSGLAVLTALFALIAGFGRRTGAIALALGILANPLVVLHVLRWIESLAS